MTDSRLQIRTTPALRKQLEELAAARNTTLTGAVKAAILEAAPLEGGIPSEQEVLEMLGQAARLGSVSAMRELLAYHRERAETERYLAPLAGVDELAARRAADEE